MSALLKIESNLMKFLDQARVTIRSGNGGNGCLSFRREKNIEFGGPDGGNGGRGGNVHVACVANLNTLVDYRYRQHFYAQNGEGGMGRDRNGGKGDNVTLQVPPGTQIFAEDNLTLLADLTIPGEEVILSTGGNGGFGNAHFKSSTNRAPRRTNPGILGEEMIVWLRLKLIADAGLVGLPNAGKSTFLAAVSAAEPKIANYPFTTIHPNLGLVKVGDKDFVLADIPGLIEGASEGIGLGTRFLGHVERCRVLIHLIDATQPEPGKAYKTVRHELATYSQELAEKPEILALSKMDAVSSEELADMVKELEELTGHTPLVISGVTHQNVTQTLFEVAKHIERGKQEDSAQKNPTPENWHP